MTAETRLDLLIVGQTPEFHVGAHLFRAARTLGLRCELMDAEEAYRGPRLLRSLAWRCLGRLPLRLESFSKRVLDRCRETRPRVLLTTGIAPVSAEVLKAIKAMGTKQVNFLTDDPWNRAHAAPWFFRALPQYDKIFSPRHANMADLSSHGCTVAYLPFAYSPNIHFPEMPSGDAVEALSCDLVFVGGADPDRVLYARSALKSGVRLHLYGGYWERYSDLKPWARGHADVQQMRKISHAAALTLCLVRRANRDGHAMRSFEAPAMNACCLMEDTEDHRRIFGENGNAALFFREPAELETILPALLRDRNELARMRAEAHTLITAGSHTYSDRLQTILATIEGPVPNA